MPEDISVKIEGLAELDAKLKNLPAKLQQRALRKALKAGADPIANAARANVHKKSGALADGIQVQVGFSIATAAEHDYLASAGLGDTPDAATAIISVRGPTARRAHLTEFGAGPHVERARRKKVLASKDGVIFGKVVNHPGAKAYPFMRPAFDTEKQNALDAIVEVLREEVDKAAKEKA